MKFALFVFCLMLAGCGPIFDGPAPLNIIVLNERPSAPLCGEALPWQLLLVQAGIYAGLDTDRIALLLDEREVKYLPEYKWEAPSPLLVLRHLDDGLNKSGCFAGVGFGGSGLNTPFRLLVDIKRMHFLPRGVDYPDALEILLTLTLIDAENGRLIRREDVLARRQGDYAEPYDMGAALELALEDIAQKAALWSRKTLAAYRP
jgi:ABC-type uncharacterized transport system auxiliary subunit